MRNPFFFNRYSLIVPHNKKAKINRSHFVCYLFDFCHHCVCLGIYCIIRNQYDELCAILFGIAFTVFTYKSKDEFPPSFTISYINYLQGYVAGLVAILYGLAKIFSTCTVDPSLSARHPIAYFPLSNPSFYFSVDYCCSNNSKCSASLS